MINVSEVCAGRGAGREMEDEVTMLRGRCGGGGEKGFLLLRPTWSDWRCSWCWWESGGKDGQDGGSGGCRLRDAKAAMCGRGKGTREGGRAVILNRLFCFVRDVDGV